MRVRVSYTMEYEEVPNLIQDLLTSCQEEFVSLSKERLNVFDASATLINIINVRERLKQIDSRLEDSSSILVGYDHAEHEGLAMETDESCEQLEVDNVD